MTDLLITSLQNEQVKTLVKLRNRKTRDKLGLTIIEEPLVIQRAFQAGYPLTTVYHCPEHLDDEGRATLQLLRSSPELRFVEMTSPVMAKVAYREQSEGLMILAPRIASKLADLPSIENPLYVILEAVEKPGNLGAVLRIADGAGAHAVLVCGQGTDLFNPNVLRASRGACFSVPTVEADRETILAFCRERDITTVASSPAAEATYTACDLTVPLALVLGTEHEGLSPAMMAACNTTVSIPMRGAGDSLNVSTSASVLLYEALRQRTSRLPA